MQIPNIEPGLIEEALSKLFPKEWVSEVAAETGFVKRERKISPVVFLWALVLGFGVGVQRTLGDLRRSYMEQAGHSVVPSAFYDRFTPELVEFLKRCVEKAIGHLVVEPGQVMSERLKDILDIAVIDSSLVRLHDQLAKKWPGPRTNHSPAAAKVNMLVSVFGATRSQVQIVEGTRGESKLLSIGSWVKDRILLFDLGYFSFKHFGKIMNEKGYFVSRLKSNSNPLILRSLIQHRGRTIAVEGKRLLDIKGSLRREIIDFEVLVSNSQSSNMDLVKRTALQLRVVGILNEETKDYHFYITNLPAERFPAEDIATLYRARWTIELLFKELKSYYHLESISSGKDCIVEALLYTALLTLIVSRRILGLLREQFPEHAHRMKPLRWARVFTVIADDILRNVLIYQGIHPKGYNLLLGIFVAEAIDPNVLRKENFRALITSFAKGY
ncbi:transposase, is4 family [Heliomicrobium modesticaldum Ice1]|uniref:Transposase, is4 family n=1 Tax=Heliobacterium modesticaldum (strain ATCC 51547 / Ice1) TaxID=498761 RepID=B0TD95_HELMI|nr:IS4 family transposase [Heliomicrobium modesticaldum]ABZ84136.1 transposase, is4 family [Heliomicrobium modesticaldum Ice1]